jgi:hypothetical protein
MSPTQAALDPIQLSYWLYHFCRYTICLIDNFVRSGDVPVFFQQHAVNFQLDFQEANLANLLIEFFHFYGMVQKRVTLRSQKLSH